MNRLALSGLIAAACALPALARAQDDDQELAKKLFPLYEMKDLDDNHEVFNILYKPSPHPKLRGVSNGARLLMAAHRHQPRAVGARVVGLAVVVGEHRGHAAIQPVARALEVAGAQVGDGHERGV